MQKQTKYKIWQPESTISYYQPLIFFFLNKPKKNIEDCHISSRMLHNSYDLCGHHQLINFYYHLNLCEFVIYKTNYNSNRISLRLYRYGPCLHGARLKCCTCVTCQYLSYKYNIKK